MQPVRRTVRWSLATWLAVLAGPAVAAAVYVPARAYQVQVREMFTASPHAVPASEALRLLPGLAQVEFAAHGNHLRGWFAPSANGAAVVLAHGARADRSQLLPEAAALHDAGFGVLMFDWPGHGESEGSPRWSAAELAAMQEAVNFLARQPSVRDANIGALGFSMGGYMTAIAAAGDTRMRAIALCAAPVDLTTQADWEFNYYGWPSRLGARWANRRFGPAPSAPTPRTALPKLVGRPVLLVAGEHDPIVPPWMSDQLYAQARGHRRRVVVPTARHTGFGQINTAYLAAVRGFFESALLKP